MFCRLLQHARGRRRGFLRGRGRDIGGLLLLLRWLLAHILPSTTRREVPGWGIAGTVAVAAAELGGSSLAAAETVATFEAAGVGGLVGGRRQAVGRIVGAVVGEG